MKYLTFMAAIVVLLAIIVIPRFYGQTETNAPVLSDEDALKIARNYVETSIENTRATEAIVTSSENGKWKITVTYEQGRGANCKVGKCYWEGPAAMFCRPETNQSLGECQ